MTRADEGRFAYSGLARIFHERGRLAVCTCLIANPEGLSFSDLQRACGLTDGNLSRHLQALSEMKIVSLERHAEGGRPTTTCTITRSGRARFLAYVDVLEAVVRDVQRGAARKRGARARSTVPGLATT
ncbi:transcriptional regulator [bacterium]|nr:MAG: transcriptional regulator [bacterium]